jgi:hypothetical protein
VAARQPQIDNASWSFRCDDGSADWISWDGKLYHVYYYNGTTVTLDASGHFVSSSDGGVLTSNGQTTPYVTGTQDGVTYTQTDSPGGGQTCVTQRFQSTPYTNCY